MKNKTAANNVYRLFNATLLDLVFHYIKKPATLIKNYHFHLLGRVTGRGGSLQQIYLPSASSSNFAKELNLLLQYLGIKIRAIIQGAVFGENFLIEHWKSSLRVLEPTAELTTLLRFLMIPPNPMCR